MFRFLGMNIQYSLIFSVYEVTHIIVNVELGVLLWQQYLNFKSLKTEISANLVQTHFFPLEFEHLHPVKFR